MKTIYLISLLISTIVGIIKLVGYITGIIEILNGTYDNLRNKIPVLPSKLNYILGGIEHLSIIIVIYFGWLIYLYH